MNTITKKYLVITFCVSWLLWGSVAIAGNAGIGFLSFGSPLGTILYVLGGVSPAICEILLKKSNSSKEEFQSFVKSILYGCMYTQSVVQWRFRQSRYSLDLHR